MYNMRSRTLKEMYTEEMPQIRKKKKTSEMEKLKDTKTTRKVRICSQEAYLKTLQPQLRGKKDFYLCHL